MPNSKIKVGLIHKAKYPISGYGGTERIVWWLAKGLSQLGLEVILASEKGGSCPFAKVVYVKDWERFQDFPKVDILHLHNTPSQEPNLPYIVTIHGNGKPGESFSQNTVFISKNHAERHGAQCFVYNAIDPDEYIFQKEKLDYLVFLAKASWKVKNVKGAIRFASIAQEELHILGGKNLFLNHWGKLHWEGIMSGEKKAKWLAGAKGLLFPVLWHEPFGVAVIESFASGTPVLASPFGSLPELINPEVGRICKTEEDFIDGIKNLRSFSPQKCRDWMMSNFYYERMAKDYVRLYEKILNGEKLNNHQPKASELVQKAMTISRRLE